MANARRFIFAFVLFCLFVTTPAQTSLAWHESDVPSANGQPAQEIPASFDLVAENELFQLYVDSTTMAFKVVDKRSGYIWNSSLDEVAEGDKLNKTWTAFAQSGISIEYLDAQAVNKRISITNSNTTVTVSPIDQGIRATLDFIDVSIKLDVLLVLESDGVRMEVPFDSIEQNNAEFKLGRLYVYPFFGAIRDDSVSGYMFIPDGMGSLIRFSATTKAQTMFYGRYYGPDLGMIVYLPYDPTLNRASEISLPVFGMVHGEMQNAFLAVVEDGASYGELQVHPAGVITNFNFLYNTFIYNESYFQATNRSGAGVTTLQPETNVFDVTVHYRFLTGSASDYVGMARSYQQYLLDHGMLNRVTDNGPDIGLRLEFLGGDKKKVLLWNDLVEMTTVEQMQAILDDLAIPNADVIYYGWQPLGATSEPPQTLKLDRRLGTVEQLRSLSEQIAAGGGDFYLYLDPQAAVRDESGYSPRYDLAMSITDANLIGYYRGKVNYYFNYRTLEDRYASFRIDVSRELPDVGLALDGIGFNLYSDFKPQNLLDRETAIDQYRSLLAGDVRLAFYTPNDYVFDYMNAYYDIPLGDNGYIYTSEAVPFLQVVLAGYVPYYAPALNFSSDIRSDVLRMADYGVYPSFFLTEEVTAKMLETNSSWIYTSSYGQWGQEVKETYEWLNGLLGPVKGQEIVARQTLAEGVSATTYANGLQVVVNYNDYLYYGGGFFVRARDALLREVNP